MNEEAIDIELLDQGLDDMLDLWWISGVVARHRGLEPNDWSGALAPTLSAIRRLLERGLAIAGDVVKNEDGLLEVRSWELPPDTTVQRIEAAARELGRPPNAGDVVWLELTDRGRAEAKAATSDPE